MTKEDAIQKIMESCQELNNAQWMAEKFVYDTLDYCHREDFPPSLVYTGIQFVRNVDELSKRKTDAPLKALQEGDSRFEFAISPINTTEDADSVFNSIKSKLNLYRKVGWTGWS